MNYQETAEKYLRKHGIINDAEIKEILSGFNFTKPVYENRIWPGDRIYQFIRKPNFKGSFETGRWFSLKGANMDSLGIFSGESGSRLTEFLVTNEIVVLEGTAKELALNWSWAGGGKGGATQLFIPRQFFYALEGAGSH